MWATHLPYYSEYQGRRKGMDVNNGQATATSAPAVNGSDARQSMADMLGPAVDGPPSPERLRQLSKQAKHASHLRRTTGHRTVSSSTSSLRPGTSERPPWETAFDNMSLARNGSTASSIASRDRDSMQILGRNLFQRRNKRESKSSSGSSMYSADTSTDNSFVAGATDKLSVPSLFSRRKTAQDDTMAQKKLQISGPFNFEHISSTKREHVPDPTAFPSPTAATSPSALRSLEAKQTGSYFDSPVNSSTERFAPLSAPMQRPSFVARNTAPNAQRILKHSRSQDQLRSSPPRGMRPVRSPYRHEHSSSASSPPVPPPRMSSQRFDSPPSFHRPTTSGGFRAPQPFSPCESVEERSPPATSYGYMTNVDAESLSPKQFSHALSTPDHEAWPLPTPEEPSYPETPLEDVPEEEEHHQLGHRSRASQASINSSLRGSQSVPMLRSAAQRPMSGASDTLGLVQTNNSGARPASPNGNQPRPSGEMAANWEDCIDYCYEHEADANFNYQWDRTSCEEDRGALGLGIDELSGFRAESTTPQLPVRSALRLNAKESSPEVVVHREEAPAPFSNNFSLPRGKPNHLSHLNVRPMSIAESFKESDGFTLSPSMLIPGDYHQAMLESANDEYEYDGQIPAVPYRNTHEGDFEASLNTTQQRSSTSTSASTAPSDSTNGRHISATSTWTASTRLTASTTSLTKLATSVADSTKASSPSSATEPKDFFEQAASTTESDIDNDADGDAVPDLIPFPTTAGPRRSGHKTTASESINRDDVLTMKSGGGAPVTRRPRARTSSLSQTTPPVGQYALFPRTSHRPTGDRI